MFGLGKIFSKKGPSPSTIFESIERVVDIEFAKLSNEENIQYPADSLVNSCSSILREVEKLKGKSLSSEETADLNKYNSSCMILHKLADDSELMELTPIHVADAFNDAELPDNPTAGECEEYLLKVKSIFNNY